MPGPLLADVSKTHLVTSLSAMIALSVAIIGLIYRTNKKALFFGWDSLAILAIYLLNISVLYALR